ncbi:MAG: LysR family transcriptional regulator [Eubacteriales bacterium]|nr:LysR family transcriptional regulator [Eubacteriales bacterium]
MIETRLLHYFLAIAREQNMTKAAELLHVTQSTLSKQMMDLEAQLGKQLFIRGKRKLTLTDDGEYLRTKAQEILNLIDTTENTLRSDDRVITGDIHIGCGETAVMEILTDVYAELQRLHPDVRLHLFSGDAEAVTDRLDKGLIDMGLLLGPYHQEKYNYLDIGCKDTFGLLMPRNCKLAQSHEIPLEQLSALPLILPDQLYTYGQRYENIRLNPDELKVTATYNLIHNATYLVERNIGYAYCLDRLVNTEGSRNLTFRPITPEISVSLFLVTKRYQTFSPAVKKFLELMQKRL